MPERGGQIGQDFEIIIINDASTDDTLLKCKALEREGITIIDKKENQGVSAARNAGIPLARGELLWFVDADDLIREGSLNEIWNKYANDKNPCDGVRISACRVGDHSRPGEIEFINSPKFSRTAVNYIVKKEFLLEHHIQFPLNVAYGEDTLFVFRLYIHKGNFRDLTSIPLYFYRMNPSSAMHTPNPEKRMESAWKMLDYYEDFLNSRRDDLDERQIENIKERIRWSVANICSDAVRLLDKKSARLILERLKQDGRYPYPILWKRLSLKEGTRSFLVNLFFLPLCFELYYKIINLLYNHKKKR